ncbi:hypothetical protein BDF14DRAFT_1695968, partial [Spinellus fusiger]
MHCFITTDKIPESDPTETETVQNELYDSVDLELHYWEQPEINRKVTEPDIKKRMD